MARRSLRAALQNAAVGEETAEALAEEVSSAVNNAVTAALERTLLSPQFEISLGRAACEPAPKKAHEKVCQPKPECEKHAEHVPLP